MILKEKALKYVHKQLKTKHSPLSIVGKDEYISATSGCASCSTPGGTLDNNGRANSLTSELKLLYKMATANATLESPMTRGCDDI